MRRTIKVGVAALAFAGLGAGLYRVGAVPARAEGDAFSEGQVKSIEKIVKDYLISHPEIILEMQAAYEKKEGEKRAEALMSRMPAFYKALAGMKDELAPLSVGNGDVTVIEFFDYNCGYCRQTLPEVLKLIDNDKHLKVQFLEFPILAPGSAEASKIAIAAAKQGKYFEFHKAMFSAGRASKESALKVAQQLGLNMDRLNKDAASPETQALLTKLNDLAKTVYIDGTPSFIVGDKGNPGATDYEQLKQLVDETRQQGCKACSAEAVTPAAGAKEEKKS